MTSTNDHPPCTSCPWRLDNPWTHYPDLPLWCGYWWDHLRADSGWCRDKREGQVPNPPPKTRHTEPVGHPTNHDLPLTQGSPLTCYECALFQPAKGENPRQAWGQCTKTGRGRYGVAHACDNILTNSTRGEVHPHTHPWP